MEFEVINWDLLALDKYFARKTVAQTGLVFIVTDQKCCPAPVKSCRLKAPQESFVLGFIFHTKVFKTVSES